MPKKGGTVAKRIRLWGESSPGNLYLAKEKNEPQKHLLHSVAKKKLNALPVRRGKVIEESQEEMREQSPR